MIGIARLFIVLVVALALFSCNTQSPVFTPAKNDPNYHCHNTDGSVIVDATWCFPSDGTHTCCWDNATCIPPDPDGVSRGCAFPETDHTFGARPPASRMPE